MAAQSKLAELEQEYGKSIREILISAYKEYGQQKIVAEALGVTPSTISRWLLLSNLEEQTTLKDRIGYGVTAKGKLALQESK